MGNCGSICTSNISRLKGDIVMDKLIAENDEEINDYTYNIYKVKYLQKVIKHFLRKKKNQKSNYVRNKSKKQTGNRRKQDKIIENNLIVQINYNSHSKKSSSKSQNFKYSSNNKNSIQTKSHQNDCSPKNRTPKNSSPKNRSPKNKSPKNRSPKNKGKNISFPKKFQVKENKDTNNLISEIEICKKYNDDEPNNDNSIFIPTLKPELFEKEIFKKDPFRIGIRNSKYENDPRDAPNDNIRRNYPKIIENNSSYLGEWKNGKRDGLGLLCWEDESKFFGYFSENVVVGYGRLWHQNGDSYKGQWKNFQADGWGIYYIQKGAFFRGMWTADKQNGFGIERWPRGSVFFGDYNMGNKNGIGVLNFESHAWYEGEFKNGVISGFGSFFFEDGRRYQGMWKNNKMDGYGYIIWPDNNTYEGEFKEDRKEGFGICIIGKKTFMGMWYNNKLEGKVIVIEEGKLKKQFWENGKALKNLSVDTPIIFEKFAQIYKNKN